MTVIVLLILSFGFSFAHFSSGQFAIPRDAVVKITGQGTRDNKNEFPCRYKLTVREVRHQFRIAHQLRDGDLENTYAWYPCYKTGTIDYQGKTYHWKLGEDHLIETDWPDGKNRGLGGTATEDLSAGARDKEK